jgi:hypothetical protein
VADIEGQQEIGRAGGILPDEADMFQPDGFGVGCRS